MIDKFCSRYILIKKALFIIGLVAVIPSILLALSGDRYFIAFLLPYGLIAWGIDAVLSYYAKDNISIGYVTISPDSSQVHRLIGTFIGIAWIGIGVVIVAGTIYT
jgi:hypothetical protein